LFTVSKSWFEAAWIYENLAFAYTGDSILLIQEGVLALQSSITLKSFLAKCESNSVKVFALKDDCDLRGITNRYQNIQLLDYHGFVELVIENKKQVSW
jgi:tRNA 2-thiouridine synthesizing protein B